LLRDSDCQTFPELNSIWEKHWRTNPKLRDAVEELWSTEEDWDRFLKLRDGGSQDEKVIWN
jgi:hypothetical protein